MARAMQIGVILEMVLERIIAMYSVSAELLCNNFADTPSPDKEKPEKSRELQNLEFFPVFACGSSTLFAKLAEAK